MTTFLPAAVRSRFSFVRLLGTALLLCCGAAWSQSPVGYHNVASAAMGARPTASSSDARNVPRFLNDGLSFPAPPHGWWEDSTHDAFPDWAQVTFNGWKIIDKIDVVTVADSEFGSPSSHVYGIRDYTVEGWTGTAWVVLATVTGNTRAWNEHRFAAFLTDRIRVTVTAANYFKSRIVEIQAYGFAAESPFIANVALASAGAVASASSSHGAAFPVAAVNDGDHVGAGWGSGGGWEDGTHGLYPDWVQIDFAGAKTIDRVEVYTLRDTVGSTYEIPDDWYSDSYVIKDFTVEGWTGSAWVTLGAVTDNVYARRTVRFADFTTDRIRVNVTRARYFKSRIVEIEAWTPDPDFFSNVALASAGAVATASSTYGLGTPAMAVIDNRRSGTPWGSGGGWEDATHDAYPDWVQIDFNGTKVIDRVVLYTLRDDPSDTTEPGEIHGFGMYGVTGFNVQGWGGSGWVTLATVTGNNLVKRTVTFAPFATDRIRIEVTSALYFKSRIVEIEAWGVRGSPGMSRNVALAAAGAVATASSSSGPSAPVSAVNDYDRTGARWGSGGGWEDATHNTYPDWVQVAFNGTKTLDRVVVYTLRDDVGNTAEPDDTTTFSAYGIVDFTVEGWNGSAWVNLGTVTGNNRVKRTVTFAPFTTDRIRVNVTNGRYFKSRIVEIEAWGS